jgi:environmental stress-induced protein Ves
MPSLTKKVKVVPEAKGIQWRMHMAKGGKSTQFSVLEDGVKVATVSTGRPMTIKEVGALASQ